MKAELLKKLLRANGAIFDRQGGNHEVWKAGDGEELYVPRHPNVKEGTAKNLIKKAKAHK